MLNIDLPSSIERDIKREAKRVNKPASFIIELAVKDFLSRLQYPATPTTTTTSIFEFIATYNSINEPELDSHIVMDDRRNNVERRFNFN